MRGELIPVAIPIPATVRYCQSKGRQENGNYCDGESEQEIDNDMEYVLGEGKIFGLI